MPYEGSMGLSEFGVGIMGPHRGLGFRVYALGFREHAHIYEYRLLLTGAYGDWGNECMSSSSFSIIVS